MPDKMSLIPESGDEAAIQFFDNIRVGKVNRRGLLGFVAIEEADERKRFNFPFFVNYQTARKDIVKGWRRKLIVIKYEILSFIRPSYSLFF
jgi:hypothetical protein